MEKCTKGRINYPREHNAWEVYHRIPDLFNMKFENQTIL